MHIEPPNAIMHGRMSRKRGDAHVVTGAICGHGLEDTRLKSGQHLRQFTGWDGQVRRACADEPFVAEAVPVLTVHEVQVVAIAHEVPGTPQESGGDNHAPQVILAGRGLAVIIGGIVLHVACADGFLSPHRGAFATGTLGTTASPCNGSERPLLWRKPVSIFPYNFAVLLPHHRPSLVNPPGAPRRPGADPPQHQ